jgi:alkylation response protein AidB-like acyl-CoA dehydrogenase
MTAGGVALFGVDADVTGHEVTPLQSVDLTRRTSRHTFDDASGRLLVAPERGDEVVERVCDLAAIALAAELSGVARSVLDATVAYAKDRYQFGRPIGSFQAIKHRCVDMLVKADAIRTAAIYAAWSSTQPDHDLAADASLAFAVAAEGAVEVTGWAIQIFGGIGMTWEHPAHLYFRRAAAAEALLGSVGSHRERLARRLWQGA